MRGGVQLLPPVQVQAARARSRRARGRYPRGKSRPPAGPSDAGRRPATATPRPSRLRKAPRPHLSGPMPRRGESSARRSRTGSGRGASTGSPRRGSRDGRIPTGQRPVQDATRCLPPLQESPAPSATSRSQARGTDEFAQAILPEVQQARRIVHARPRRFPNEVSTLRHAVFCTRTVPDKHLQGRLHRSTTDPRGRARPATRGVGPRGRQARAPHPTISARCSRPRRASRPQVRRAWARRAPAAPSEAVSASGPIHEGVRRARKRPSTEHLPAPVSARAEVDTQDCRVLEAA